MRGGKEEKQKGRRRKGSRREGTITAPHPTCKLTSTSGYGVLGSPAPHLLSAPPATSRTSLSLTPFSSHTGHLSFSQTNCGPSHLQMPSYTAPLLFSLATTTPYPANWTLGPCLTFLRKLSQIPHSLALYPQLHGPRATLLMAPELSELLPITIFPVGNHSAVSLYH